MKLNAKFLTAAAMLLLVFLGGAVNAWAGPDDSGSSRDDSDDRSCSCGGGVRG